MKTCHPLSSRLERTMNVKSSRRRAAFTLIEVLLVLAILVVLGSLVTVSVVQVQKSSNMKAAKSQINMLDTAVNTYRINVGSWPETLNDLREQPANIKNPEKWSAVLDKALPQDPWGNDYQYRVEGDKFIISSWGPDRSEGGNDDISNE
jgi:general secretion pathway protein G